MERELPNVILAKRTAFDPFLGPLLLAEQPVRKILVVGEFDPFSRLLLHTLGRTGFTVYCVKSPAIGLALFHEHQAQIDLVAIDAMTPSPGYLDLAAELERLRPGLPVLYVVGASRTVVRCSIEAHSPEAALAAPFTELQLTDRIRTLLQAEEEMSERLTSAA